MQPEDQALSKALALIERTGHRLRQIDSSAYPTDETKIARDLLWASLERLGAVENWESLSPTTKQPPVSPQVLYRALIDFQEFITAVESSNLEHISWPVVNYCRELWEALFPKTDDKRPHVFYSAQTRHNYSIGSFDAHLGQLLCPVLGSQNEVAAFFAGIPLHGALFCLRIPTVEDQNLPLYANIGHEFGHALLKHHRTDFDRLWSEEFAAFWEQTISKFSTLGDKTIAWRFCQVLESFAEELVCDRVGAAISGPAFLLSLQEMLWGFDPDLWQVNLRPELSEITAYPGNAFRIECLRDAGPLLALPNFIRDIREHLARDLPHQQMRFQGWSGHEEEPFDLLLLDKVFAVTPTKAASERVEVVPAGDRDAALFRDVFRKVLPQLRDTLRRFAKRYEDEILLPIRHKFQPLQADHIASLLVRLHHSVLPNIVPDETLLGVPAQFSTILNASAIYRACLLSQRNGKDGPESIDHKLQKIERLTSKALEVTYIQHDYNRSFPKHQP